MMSQHFSWISLSFLKPMTIYLQASFNSINALTCLLNNILKPQTSPCVKATRKMLMKLTQGYQKIDKYVNSIDKGKLTALQLKSVSWICTTLSWLNFLLLVRGLSRFSLVPQQPLKMKLALRVVKSNSKIIISLR